MKKIVTALVALASRCTLGLLEPESPSEWAKKSIYFLLTDRFALHQRNASDPCSSDTAMYCGGSFQGIIEKLDYISGMGFNAIWISPVVENTKGGYHGYWAKNIYEIEPHFGSADDLMSLVEECHQRGISVMLDVVANHMGIQVISHDDFTQFFPFNASIHFHPDCAIENWDDPHQVEYCRLAGLPDLDQDNPWVRAELKKWIWWIVQKFGFDALRIDTVKHVKKQFWVEFVKAAGVFATGEVYDGRPDTAYSFSDAIPSPLNYPLFYTLRSVFLNPTASMREISARVTEMQAFQPFQAGLLANFLDNHDNERWLHANRDWTPLKNALTYLFLSKGIPVVYYGTEQAFAAADNREPAFDRLDASHPLYSFIASLNALRRLAVKSSSAAGGFFSTAQVQKCVLLAASSRHTTDASLARLVPGIGTGQCKPEPLVFGRPTFDPYEVFFKISVVAP